MFGPVGPFGRKSRAFSREHSISRGFSRLASFVESPDQQRGPDQGKNRGGPCSFYLPLTGCGSQLSGIGSLLLGGQILGLMLVGFGFACGLVFGLINALDNPNRHRRRLGWAIETFYGWAWLGHPLAFWGLRGYLIGGP